MHQACTLLFLVCCVWMQFSKAFTALGIRSQTVLNPTRGYFVARSPIKNRVAFSRPETKSPKMIRSFTMLFDKLFGANPGPPQEANFYGVLEGAAREQAEAAVNNEIPAISKDGHSIATFAGGCFWGLELMFQRLPGVVETSVGYTQGPIEKPTYSAVCSGATGHTEAVQVYYTPSEVSFTELCESFFARINPTQVNGQGNDWGTQYRTGVYTHTEEQMEEAKAVFENLKAQYKKPIATELKPAEVYWPAEKYHQQYLEKGGRFNSPQSADKGCKDEIRCYG